MSEPSTPVSKLKLVTSVMFILRGFYGLAFFVFSAAMFADKQIAVGLCALIAGMLTFPVTSREIDKTANHPLTRRQTSATVAVLVIAMLVMSKKNPTDSGPVLESARLGQSASLETLKEA